MESINSEELQDIIEHVEQNEPIQEYPRADYVEVILPNHNKEKNPKEKTEKANGYFIEDKIMNPCNEEFMFGYEKKDLDLSALKLAIQSLIKKVQGKGSDYSETPEFEDFQKRVTTGQKKYFTDRGLSYEEAEGCALALQFRSGFGKLRCRISLTHELNEFFQKRTEKIPEDSSYPTILRFLHLALMNIPFYTGKCIRAIDISKEEQDIYEEGRIINWKKFSSSSAMNEPVSPFQSRNTRFSISSLTGRDVSLFSAFSDEKEVLFPPGCNFVVEKKEIVDGKVHISLKQVDVVFTENIVLCVGNNENSNQYKPWLWNLYSKRSQKRLWIIEKPNAEEALKFLEENMTVSINSSKSFRIILKGDIAEEAKGTPQDVFTYVEKNFKGSFKACYHLEDQDYEFGEEDCKAGFKEDKLHNLSTKPQSDLKKPLIYSDENKAGISKNLNSFETCENNNVGPLLPCYNESTSELFKE